MRIKILGECNSSTIEKVHEAFDRLIPQLSSSAQPLSREEIQASGSGLLALGVRTR